MVGTGARQHPALAKLEDKQSTFGLIIQPRCQWSNTGILVPQGKSGFAFVGRDQIKALEVGNIAPPRSDLTIGGTKPPGSRRNQIRNGATIEDPMAKVGKYHRLGPGVLDRGTQFG